MYICVKKSDNSSSDIGALELCTDAVYTWLSNNGLAFNPSKSEVVKFDCRKQTINQITSVKVAGASIHLSPAIRSLGVIPDSQLTMNSHVTAVCKACYFHIRVLRHIRRSIPEDVAKMVACRIVESRLDYCNSLYAGMSKANFDKLQRVQNTLARVVTGYKRSDHITPVMADLHWLPVKSRVTFKIASNCYFADQA